MNDDYINDFIKNFGVSSKEKVDTRYQYSYVELEEVMKNPEEYIIPQCLPACRLLWDKNIETFMVSNNEDDDLYVLLSNVSSENMAIFRQLSSIDSRFITDHYRNTIGIAVKGRDDVAMQELEALTGVFELQDTLRYQTVDDFLESYKYTGGELFIDEAGDIHRKKNPALQDITLQEALKRSGKESLYVPEEGRVYESATYLNWHKRYERALETGVRETISDITPYKDNFNGDISHLRDTFLDAEREYVFELLKNEDLKDAITFINSKDSYVLFEVAQELVDKVEMGLVPENEMEKVERELVVILAAIQDRVLSKNLVLTPTRGQSKSK